MVKLSYQTSNWEKLKQPIQQALMLSDQNYNSLLLHLRDEGHLLEQLEPRPGFTAAPPYQETQFIQRIKNSTPSQENLLKAIGCRKNERPSVIDTTAGFGIDAILLAYHHCRVSCIEWNPLTCFLVGQALSLADLPHKLGLASECLQYYQNDARVLIPELPAHDVIYLDPMFPEKRKSARVKKYMQIMQSITELYPNWRYSEIDLFEIALAYAKKRVVVKRPKLEPPLVAEPNHSIKSQSVRFDVYIK